MDQLEVTKIVGAVCGSLLVFLLIQTAAHGLYNTESEQVVFQIDTGEAAGGDTGGAPAEDVAAILAAGDAAKGEAVFKKCAACHKIDGNNAVGPHLDGVVDRPKGTVAGFSYSAAIPGLGGTWSGEDLYHFLLNPKKFAAGTTMSFAGLPKPEDRANLIAYLTSFPHPQ